ncbi:hypothetical protein llg_45110 [Luteolibacter sp. LG18]|nr:hypothetical protein llg_45110 [Luteolibacter sp. LG18]
MVSIVSQGAMAAEPVPVLVKDINPVIDATGMQTDVHALTPFGNTLLFAAYDAAVGEELWKSDGTPAGTVLVKDLNPGPGSSFPRNPTVVGSQVFFVADDWVHGFQLWKTDGTAAGTVLVKDFGGGAPEVAPELLTAVGDTLFFVMPSDIEGEDDQLWKSDGTTGGTVPVIGFTANPSPLDTDTIGSMAGYGGRIFVGIGQELWVGNEAGTGFVRIAVVANGGVADTTYSFAPAADFLYFFGRGAVQMELWRTDGSVGNTSKLADVGGWYRNASSGTVGNTLFFGGLNANHGVDLWKSDGTPAGTGFVKDIICYGGGDTPLLGGFTPAGGVMYIRAYGSGIGPGLWKSDGSAQGTVVVSDLKDSRAAGAADIGVGDVGALGGRVFFSRNEPTRGRELWTTDGTAKGTRLVKDIQSGKAGSNASQPTALGANLFFVAAGQLWKTDATASTKGTVRLTQFKAGTGSSVASYTPKIVAAGNKAYFCAQDGSRGTGFWVTDGTAAGTTMLKAVTSQWPTGIIYDIAPAGSRACFVASDGKKGVNVWGSDGSTRGTVALLNMAGKPAYTQPMPSFIGSISGKACFINGKDYFDGVVWLTDGTRAGTTATPSDDTTNYPVANMPPASAGTLFFPEISLTNGSLVMTDGTVAGTRFVQANGYGTPPQGYKARDFHRIGGVWYYLASDAAHGEELWRTDGTTEGTWMVKDINPVDPIFGHPGPYETSPGAEIPRLGTLGQTVLFFANGATNGKGLWLSDGTAGGTRLLHPATEENAFMRTSHASDLVTIGGLMYFVGEDAEHGVELWRTDGTEAGTMMVKDLNVGPRASLPEGLLAVGNRLYFTAFSDLNGYELWKSDGTPEGTRQVSDLTADIDGSRPLNLSLLGNRLLFRATTAAKGTELYSLDVSADLAPAP